MNSFATDETGGVFIVSDHALYRFDAGRRGRPDGDVARGLRPRVDPEAGPALAGLGHHPDPDRRRPRRHHRQRRPAHAVRVLPTRATGRRGRARCAASRCSASAARARRRTASSPSARSVIVENNYGYENPGDDHAGPLHDARHRPGRRHAARTAATMWTSNEIAPTSVPKVSLRTGLLYVYTKPRGRRQDPWYFTAIDVRSGRTAWRRLTGTGVQWNNHYAAIYLGPDRARTSPPCPAWSGSRTARRVTRHGDVRRDRSPRRASAQPRAALLRERGHQVIGVDRAGADVAADLSTDNGRREAVREVDAACSGQAERRGAVRRTGRGHAARTAGAGLGQLLRRRRASSPGCARRWRRQPTRASRAAVVLLSSNSATCQPGWDLGVARACLRGDEAAARALAVRREAVAGLPGDEGGAGVVGTSRGGARRSGSGPASGSTPWRPGSWPRR